MRQQPTKVISLKLTESERQAVEALVATGNFPSVSAVLREGLNTVIRRFASCYKFTDQIESERRIRPGRKSTNALRLQIRQRFFKDNVTGGAKATQPGESSNTK